LITVRPSLNRRRSRWRSREARPLNVGAVCRVEVLQDDSRTSVTPPGRAGERRSCPSAPDCPRGRADDHRVLAQRRGLAAIGPLDHQEQTPLCAKGGGSSRRLVTLSLGGRVIEPSKTWKKRISPVFPRGQRSFAELTLHRAPRRSAVPDELPRASQNQVGPAGRCPRAGRCRRWQSLSVAGCCQSQVACPARPAYYRQAALFHRPGGNMSGSHEILYLGTLSWLWSTP